MNATASELKAMYQHSSTENLEHALASHEDTIRELYSIGRSWALDSREMRIAEHNSSFIRAELRRRKTGDSRVQSSQVGEAVYRDLKSAEGK